MAPSAEEMMAPATAPMTQTLPTISSPPVVTNGMSQASGQPQVIYCLLLTSTIKPLCTFDGLDLQSGILSCSMLVRHHLSCLTATAKGKGLCPYTQAFTGFEARRTHSECLVTQKMLSAGGNVCRGTTEGGQARAAA